MYIAFRRRKRKFGKYYKNQKLVNYNGQLQFMARIAPMEHGIPILKKFKSEGTAINTASRTNEPEALEYEVWVEDEDEGLI